MATDAEGKKIPQSIPPQSAEKVHWWDDERKRGDSLLVTLKGFAFQNASDDSAYDGAACEHVMGFDTIADARDMISRAEPCSCQVCQE